MVTPNPPGTIVPNPEWDRITMRSEIARMPFKLGIVSELDNRDPRLRSSAALSFITRPHSVEWSHVPRNVANGDCEIGALPRDSRVIGDNHVVTPAATPAATHATGADPWAAARRLGGNTRNGTTGRSSLIFRCAYVLVVAKRSRRADLPTRGERRAGDKRSADPMTGRQKRLIRRRARIAG
jgi:hypothetical protein